MIIMADKSKNKITEKEFYLMDLTILLSTWMNNQGLLSATPPGNPKAPGNNHQTCEKIKWGKTAHIFLLQDSRCF